MQSLFRSFFDLDKTKWNANLPDSNPFNNLEFYRGLEFGGCLGPQTGWLPKIISDSNGILVTFEKHHSYGEYIFDWSWAQAFEQYGQPYYPKMLSMAPFTSATKPIFLTHNNLAISKLIEQYQNTTYTQGYSSHHFLFCPENELHYFPEEFQTRYSFQYHYTNHNYQNFDDFLKSLRTRKAKSIRKERESIANIDISVITGNNLNAEHALSMYSFYLDTINKKGAIPYLTSEFFQYIFKHMPENITYVEATRNDTPIAGSLFFHSDAYLYGRYWGCLEDITNLHFELCYYQGIEICIARGLKIFEAGAQGEHKIPRGFEPTLTFSKHYIENTLFAPAVKNFIEQEKIMVKKQMQHLSTFLPYRNNNGQ